MSSQITIATAPCSWGVWYPDGTPSGTPWRTFLDQAAAAGYKALELGPDGYLPTDEGELRAELESRGLTLCSGTSVYTFDQYNSFADFRPQVEALCRRISAFGARYLVVMDESDVGLYSEKKADITPELWSRYFGMMKEMGAYTKGEWGVETVYHPHIKSLVETEEEIERMAVHTGLRFCFDIGHHAYVNGGGRRPDASPVDFIRKWPDKMAYLHFKNVDEKVFARVRAEKLDSDTAFDLDVMGDLEDGMVDYLELKKALDDIGFSGIGVIEQDMPKASAEVAFAAARRNLEYLRRIGMID